MNQEKEINKRSADTIIADLHRLSEDKSYTLDRKEWLNAAWFLVGFLGEEEKVLNGINQEISKKTLEIMNAQDKLNVARAEKEVEASDIYRLMKDQTVKVKTMERYIQVAKKSADEF
jgi:hypothetical protein